MVEQARALETLMSFFTLEEATTADSTSEHPVPPQPKPSEKPKANGKLASTRHSQANGKHSSPKRPVLKPTTSAHAEAYNEGWEEF
jgi:hypothetical protein